MIIIGAGQAGLTAATSLRDQGFTGQIHLISDEEDTPYQRPPLSKGYLAGTETTADLALCTVETLKAQESPPILVLAPRTSTARSKRSHWITAWCLNMSGSFSPLVLALGHYRCLAVRLPAFMQSVL